jgi:ankyrin repeat protein
VTVDDARTVEALLAGGFDPNARSEQGQSGLYLALREGSGKVVDTLLAHPETRIDEPNASGETPVMMAALRGNVDSTKRLLDRGAQINRKGWTPLHYAACSTEPRLLQLLLDRGADIEAASPNRTPPLMMAARYGTDDLTLLLLKHGANPRARNDLDLDAAAFARQAARDPLALQLDKLAR